MKKIYVVLILGFLLRIVGINWDQGFHLHPDERMLIMVADRINFFSNLNPDFFNYGSLPIYFLKGIAQLLDLIFKTHFSTYDGMLYLGRFLSALTDTVTVFLIYKIAELFADSSRLRQLADPRSITLINSYGSSEARAIFKGSSHNISVYSSFFYAVAVFPIQNAHFFVVDVYLTMFTTLLLYLLLNYLLISKERKRKIILISVVFAAMLSTKFTALVFYPVIIFVLIVTSILKRIDQPNRYKSEIRNPKSETNPNYPIIKKLKNCFDIRYSIFDIFNHLTLFHVLCFMFYFLFMPFSLVNFHKFLDDILLQTKMSSDPYIFPYTLQYVGTLPYLYYLKNIFLWGIGPVISILSLIGLVTFVKAGTKNLHKWKIFNFKFLILNKYKNVREKIQDSSLRQLADSNRNLWFERSPPIRRTSENSLVLHILYFIFYGLYFLVIGHSAVKFMRYMLPLYPFLCFLAGLGLLQISSLSVGKQGLKLNIKNFELKTIINASLLLILFSTFAGTVAFTSIYSLPHTRVQASNWINDNIPPGSTIATEHWDDRLPLIGSEKYTFEELTLYDRPDDSNKWKIMNKKIASSDYIILSSNRLYVPLQKLTDCQKYKYCYPMTANYYKNLFAGTLGFTKIAEFSSFPSISIGSFKFEIDDSSSDESFTVYDHPKVIIFKKNG